MTRVMFCFTTYSIYYREKYFSNIKCEITLLICHLFWVYKVILITLKTFHGSSFGRPTILTFFLFIQKSRRDSSQVKSTADLLVSYGP